MRWIDTALCQAIVGEMERHDRADGHPASVMPRGGLTGMLIVLVLCLVIILSVQLSNEPVLFGLAIAIPSALLMLWARAAAKPIMERRQLRLNDEESQRDSAKETFFFYLRPFQEDGRRPVTTRAASGSVAVLFGFEMDFEFMLSQALRWTLPVVALGQSKHSKGAIRKIVGDEEWQKAFVDLGDRCAAIVCVPGISESSLWELRQIRAHSALLNKTAFFMPPRIGMRIQRIIPEIIGGRTKRRWNAARGECEKFGLHLPEYRSDGCMFFIREDGRTEGTFHLWGFDPARIETLCFAAATRHQLSAEDVRTGLAALAAKRPLRQRVVALFFTRHAIPAGIWTPIIWGSLSILIQLATTGLLP
jgi:hypothetical protein